MNDPRWGRVGELFHQLAERSRDEQEVALAELARSEPEVAAELRSLLTADRHPERIPEPAAFAAPEPTLAPGTQLGPYRIVAELARGGMGVVYRGERADGAFERQVAIKLARPDLVSPLVGARFAEERRILAGLDHPGIARLLDAGTDGEGRLFLVLDLVQGQRLDHWATNRPLGERLELLLAVCDAVEHAHRRLVLHRDLKPANVLVTAGGRPKLLDFGIARLLGEDGLPGEATRLGLRPLTPEYASPEQLRGETLTTASDVYSLGVVLFELVTGKRPFALPDTTSPEERARHLATTPVPRASGVRSRRTGDDAAVVALGRLARADDLDAVVTRALAPDPAARYTTVAALAEDLRRYLDGRPVTARLPSMGQRVALFVRRHRTAVAVATAFVIVLLVATAYSLRQAAIAARERAAAVERFEDLRQLARVFLFDLPDRIERLPGSTAARELLVETGLQYLDRLRQAGGDDPRLLAELAAGYERLGQVQAGFFAANVGESAAALTTFDRAIELRTALAAGADPEADRRLAEAHLLRATALFKNGRIADALTASTRALAGVAPQASTAGDADHRLRARVLALHGFLQAASGDLTTGEVSLREALALYDGLGAAAAREPAVRAERARALERLGTVLGQRREAYPEVQRLWSEALALDRALLAEEPRNPARRRMVSGDLTRLSFLRYNEGAHADALVLSGEALALSVALAEEDPDDFEAQRLAALQRGRRSVDLIAIGRLDEAEAEARASLEVTTRLLARDPTNVTVEVLVASAHQGVGAALMARARRDRTATRWRAARDELLAAVTILDRLIDRGVLAKNLTEAAEAEATRALIAECDRALAASGAD